MLIYNIISIACLAIMMAVAIWFIVSYFTQNRQGRINYLRGYKQGKAVVIYLISMPLYWIGCIYQGQNVLNGFFNAVSQIVELVFLKYNLSAVQSLVNDSVIYAVALYSCYILVCINAILLAISLLGQGVWHYITVKRFLHTRRERLLIYGNNQNNIHIYNSDKARAKLIVDDFTREQTTQLFVNNVAYISLDAIKALTKKLSKSYYHPHQRNVIIINTGDDQKNIRICRVYIDIINKMSESEQKICFEALRMFVYGDPRCQTLYDELMKDAKGCLTYVDKYQKIAVDFVDKYPFTKFMTKEQIDYDTSLIKEDVNINALLIGFGKANQQVFLTSVANNQFLTKDKQGLQLKKVQYHIFDKENAQNNKNLNHNYYRYQNECDFVNQADYLPLPSYPADEHYHILDINDNKFYQTIRSVIANSRKDANFIVIAFGTDLENVDFAHKLLVKCKEWDISNVTIFVKVSGDYLDKTLLDSYNCYFIGNEKEIVYDINSILADKMTNMSQMRNIVYKMEYELTHNNVTTLSQEQVQQITEQSWYEWFVGNSQSQRESNQYCILSLRSKLNLMGLDYCPKDANDLPAITEQEYLNRYAKDDMPDIEFYNQKIEGKPIVNYTIDFKQSRRRTMAIQEHYRWNSFMISKGTIPATKQQILNEMIAKKDKMVHSNGKNYELRRHGNITTFDGLVEFRQIVAKRDGCAEADCDVIKYDYQLLDDAFWLLDKNGYKIINKI